MVGAIYGTMLFLAAAFVIVRGGNEERAFVVTLFAASLGTFFIISSSHARFNEPSLALLANEAVLLGVALTIAYRSKRFWPLPVASFELAAFLSLLVPFFGKNLVPYAVGVTQGLWAYLQLLIVIMAVVRTRHKSSSSPT